MRMIRKLGEDKKADWPEHLAEIVHAYNATQSAMTRYSPHYLMFGWRPRLPVNFYFPTFRSTEAPTRGTSAKHVDEYMATVHDQLRATFWEPQAQSMAEAQWQKWYYEVVHQIVTAISSYKVMDQCRQKSSTAIDSSSSHQKLAFPWVWVSAECGTDVPAPPQLSQLPEGVIVRIHHKRKVVWWSPSIRPDRLCWGRSMGSYSFYLRCPLEYP